MNALRRSIDQEPSRAELQQIHSFLSGNHSRIIDAIAAGDVTAAESAMQANYEFWLDFYAATAITAPLPRMDAA